MTKIMMTRRSFQYCAALLLISPMIASASAFAMGGKPLDSKGTVNVNEPFAISSNYDFSNGKRSAISLGRGSHALELESSYEEKQPSGSPIGFFNQNHEDDDTPVAILLNLSAGDQYAHLRLPLLIENSQSLVPAASTGQQFDMLVSVKKVEANLLPARKRRNAR